MASRRPQRTGTRHRLPFGELSPGDFERLCLWLVRREGYSDVQHLGEAGSEQGRDVVAFRDGRRFVFQCKRVQSFGPATARVEIEKLRGLPDDQQPDEIVFVVSRAVSARARREIREAWGDARTCRFWAGNELDERVKRYPEILEEFFELPGDKPRLQDREPGARMAADDERRDFFISYTQADRAWAEWIGWTLEQAGYSVILQAWDFAPGSNFPVEIDRAIKTAERTIAVLSPDYMASPFTPSEWGAAFAKDPKGLKRKLVPVRVRLCEPDGLLAQVEYIDLVGIANREARRRLLDRLRGGRPDTEPDFPGEADEPTPDSPRFPGPLPSGHNKARSTVAKRAGLASETAPDDYRKPNFDEDDMVRIRARLDGCTGQTRRGADSRRVLVRRREVAIVPWYVAQSWWARKTCRVLGSALPVSPADPGKVKIWTRNGVEIEASRADAQELYEKGEATWEPPTAETFATARYKEHDSMKAIVRRIVREAKASLLDKPTDPLAESRLDKRVMERLWTLYDEYDSACRKVGHKCLASHRPALDKLERILDGDFNNDHHNLRALAADREKWLEGYADPALQDEAT